VSTLVVLILSGFKTNAQEADSALYRKLKISKINSWVKLPTMPRKTDSCKNEVKHLNRQGLITYIKTDYSCFGWSRTDETFITYDEYNRPITYKYLSKDILVSHTSYFYNDHGDIIREIRLFFDPNDTLVMNYTITYDSISRKIREHVVCQGSKGQEPYISTFAYDSTGKIISKTITNEAGEKMASYSYKYNERGQLTSETFESQKPSYSFTQQLFQYDEEGLLKKNINTADNTATEYWFFPNGLVNRLYCYNRFGTMDREYMTQYEYFEDGN
jgi:hypothetical protein